MTPTLPIGLPPEVPPIRPAVPLISPAVAINRTRWSNSGAMC
jgi:hypothetical protein